MEPSVRELDLTQYVDGRDVMIADAQVEAGAYDAIRLTVDQVTGTLKDGSPRAVDVAFGPVALDFRVRVGRTTALLLDLLVLDVSDDRPGQPYELHIREAAVIQDQ